MTTQTMSSLEIAEVTGKRHPDVRRDIKRMLDRAGIDESGFKGQYKDIQNRKQTHYSLPYAMAIDLQARYTHGGQPCKGAQELAALRAISQVLDIKLTRQFKVLDFFIDGYDEANHIAYEIDEEHHKHQIAADMERQKLIEKELGCTFVRITV